MTPVHVFFLAIASILFCSHIATSEGLTDFERCDLLLDPNGLFRPCINRRELNLFNYQLNGICQFDVCTNLTSACDLVQMLVIRCQQLGVSIDDWRNASDCPFKCPAGFVNQTGNCSCAQDCTGRNVLLPADERTDLVCRCPSNRYLFGGKCLSCCGCVDNDGVYRQPGETWTDLDCNSYQCNPSGQGTGPCTSTISAPTTICTDRNSACVNGTCISG